MNAVCAEHPGKEAVGACVGCGHFICETCRVLVGGKNWCKTCIERGESPVDRRRERPATGTGSFYRSRRDRVFGGVCGGIATATGMDPTLVRVLAACTLLFTAFAAGVVYIVLWAAIPLE